MVSIADGTTWDMANTDVVFLGAGFSRCATNGASPLMRDFFATLDDRKYWCLHKFLVECFPNPREANVEEALLKLDQLCSSPLEGKDSFFDQCRKRHSDVRSELDDFIIERLGQLPIEDDNWAAWFLHSASDRTTAITTNYDNLAESILSHRDGLQHRVPNTNCHHCKMCRLLQDECAYGGPIPDDRPVWEGSLIKLHGSVAWMMCSNPACSTSKCLIPDEHCVPIKDPKCDCCGNQCSPVLVHPSMTKSFDCFRGLKLMWNAAYEALSAASRLLFFGFSFPTSDALFNEVIRSTLGRSDRTLTIGVVDTDPTSPVDRLTQLLTNSRATTVYRLVVPNDGSQPRWFDQTQSA